MGHNAKACVSKAASASNHNTEYYPLHVPSTRQNKFFAFLVGGFTPFE